MINLKIRFIMIIIILRTYFYHEMNTGFSQEFFFVTKTHQSSPIILFIMSVLSKGFFLTEFTGFTRWIFFCRGRFYIDPCIIETFGQKFDLTPTIKHLLGLPLANALPHLHVRVSRWETLYLWHPQGMHLQSYNSRG